MYVESVDIAIVVCFSHMFVYQAGNIPLYAATGAAMVLSKRTLSLDGANLTVRPKLKL